MQHAFDMAGVRVTLVMPVHRDIDSRVVRSICGTHSLFQSKCYPLDIQAQVGSSIVTAARSKSAHEFLKGTSTRCFWVDSDIAWKPEDFLRLVLLSTKMEVVGASYPAKRDPPVFAINVDTDADIETNEWGCVPVKGFGLGFTCVHREVIERLAEGAEKLIFPDSPDPVAHFFREDAVWGKRTDYREFRGEDNAFFSDAKRLGYQAWLDPTIVLGHIGSKEYSGSLMDHMRPLEPTLPPLPI